LVKIIIKYNSITNSKNKPKFFGDWGLGIGDWAQSPIPNPQSPIPYKLIIFILNKIFNQRIRNTKSNPFKMILIIINLKFKIF